MSDYHGLETTSKLDSIRIAIHVDTPNGDNLVGYTYSTALLEFLGGSQVSVVPWLQVQNPTEYGLIEAGEKFESVESVSYDANASQNDKVTAMNDYVAVRMPEIVSELQGRLEYWGSNRNLPT